MNGSNHGNRNNGAGKRNGREPLTSRTMVRTLKVAERRYLNVHLTARYYPHRIALELKVNEQVSLDDRTDHKGKDFIWYGGQKGLVTALIHWLHKHQLSGDLYCEIDSAVTTMWHSLKPIMLTEIRPRQAVSV